MTIELATYFNLFGQGAYDFVLPSNYGEGSDINFKFTAGLICSAPGFTYDAANCWFASYLAQVNRASINSDLAPLAISQRTYAPGALVTAYGDYLFLGGDPTIYTPSRTLITNILTEYSFTISGRNQSGSVGTGGAILRDVGGSGHEGGFTNEYGSDANCNLMARWVPQSGAAFSPYLVAPGSQNLQKNQTVSLVVQLQATGTGGFQVQAIITKISVQTFPNGWTDFDLLNGYVGMGIGSFPEAFSPQAPLSFDPTSVAPPGFANSSNLYLLNPQAVSHIPIGPALIPLPQPVYAKPVGLFYPWGGK